MATVELASRPASVRSARVFTAGVLGGDGVEASVVELAVLLVSELVTNAVVHARSGVRVTVHVGAHWVRVEVEDQGPGRPTVVRSCAISPPDSGSTWSKNSLPIGEPNAVRNARLSGSRS